MCYSLYKEIKNKQTYYTTEFAKKQESDSLTKSYKQPIIIIIMQ